MHQRGAASLHLATWHRDVETDAPSIVPLRQHANRWYHSKTMDLAQAHVNIKNMFYVVYITNSLSAGLGA